MRHAKGFTLIEVMITVAIIAVLASIALPAYTDYIRRGKIPEATSALLAQKTKFEQFFQDNRSYCATAGCPTCGVAGYVTKYFTIAAACATANTFVLRATGGTPSDSSMAGIEFTINEGNAKTTTVTSGSTMAEAGYAGASCWVAKRGGASAC